MRIFFKAPTFMAFFFISIFISCTSSLSDSSIPDLIELKKEMIINESAFGDPTFLVDEQAFSGDPANNIGNIPKSPWLKDWINKNYMPVSAIIDLGQEYIVSEVYIYNYKKSKGIKLFAGKPFEFEGYPKEESSLLNFERWDKYLINSKTRYLRIVVEENVPIHEIMVYGKPVDQKAPSEPKPQHRFEKPTMDAFIGVNAFIDDPIERLKVAGFVREYHNWNWDEGNYTREQAWQYPGYPKNENKWAPSYPGWNFDTFYAQLKEEGIVVAPCIQGNVAWIDNEKPIQPNADPLLPSSYIAHASHMFQYVARYGSRKIPEDKLKLAANQKPVSGLDLVQYYEDWNEQDAWWASREIYFSPYEYAAMASADYDGHMKELGNTVGVKNADPSAKLVMGGMAKLSLDYIKCIKLWSDYYRKGNVPFDVINLHHYSKNGKNENVGFGISPEEDSIKWKLRKFVDYRNKYMPDKEVWLTEFGYDTHPASNQRAPLIGRYSNEEVQAQWLVRAYLELIASGIDQATMYMLRDVNPNAAKRYSTSGLTSDKNSGWKPKTSWFYVYTLKNTLKDMQFVGERTNEAGVNVYEFRHINKEITAYAIWSPTSKAKIIDSFKFNVGETDNAVKVSLENQEIEGIKEILEVKNNIVNISVSESPVFIIVDPNSKKEN